MNKPLMLIVDDDDRYLGSLVLIFQKYFEVITARNLQSALKAIQSHTFAVVITDGAFSEASNMALNNPTDEDYRGSQVASAAKVRGALVIGTSSKKGEPKNADYLFKKPIDISEVLNFIKIKLNLT